jgi:chromosome segregation ATPase
LAVAQKLADTTKELTDAAEELARLNEQVKSFQATATNLVARRDALVASIATLKSAVNGAKTSTRDREHLKDRLTNDQKALDGVNAQIAENQAQQRRLQDELTAAEARVMQQVSASKPRKAKLDTTEPSWADDSPFMPVPIPRRGSNAPADTRANAGHSDTAPGKGSGLIDL